MSEAEVPASAASAGGLNPAADYHQANIMLLRGMPSHPEYITPHEILLMIRLCCAYGVDYTPGLEPLGLPGERVASFLVPIKLAEEGVIEYEERECRARIERLLEDPDGTVIPDGSILWANVLLGRLLMEASTALSASREVK